MSFYKQWKRIEYIHECIQKKSTGTPGEFAYKLGISRSMLYEYLKDLRALGAKIEYSKELHSFYYSNSFQVTLGQEDKKGGGKLVICVIKHNKHHLFLVPSGNIGRKISTFDNTISWSG